MKWEIYMQKMTRKKGQALQKETRTGKRPGLADAT